jgi:hypothetical protein
MGVDVRIIFYIMEIGWGMLTGLTWLKTGTKWQESYHTSITRKEDIYHLLAVKRRHI